MVNVEMRNYGAIVPNNVGQPVARQQNQRNWIKIAKIVAIAIAAIAVFAAACYFGGVMGFIAAAIIFSAVGIAYAVYCDQQNQRVQAQFQQIAAA